MTIHHKHLLRLLQDPKGNWRPVRLLYCAKGNGSLCTEVVTPTSLSPHADTINVSNPDGTQRRTYDTTLILKVTNPEDTLFRNATDVIVS